MANIFGGSRLLFLTHFLELIVIDTVVVIFSFCLLFIDWPNRRDRFCMIWILLTA